MNNFLDSTQPYQPSDSSKLNYSNNVSQARRLSLHYTSNYLTGMNGDDIKDMMVTASAMNFLLCGGLSSLGCTCNWDDENDVDESDEEYYDYEEMKETKSKLHKDLIDYLWHPSKLAKYLETHDTVDGYLN